MIDPFIRGMAADTISPWRRKLLKAAPAAVLACGLATWSGTAEAARKEMLEKQKEPEVTPPEDLMREHGVLHRVLLVYEAALRKFETSEDFDPAVITNAAQIVRDFIENYHEQSEEHAVFPRFRQARKLVALVDTLVSQHKAGRRVTDLILMRAPGSRKDGDDRRQLVSSVHGFIAMYRPHAAREDTDLFPLLKTIVSPHEYDAMAEDFEKKERQLFGDDGFEMMTYRVASLEQQIGIADLAQFTPA